MSDRLDVLVFSDLDGTLLDHESYSWRPAAPALDRLRAMGGGLVLASSKTAAEIAPLRDEIGFSAWPAIVENGSGLLEPGAAPGEGGDYDRLRAALATLPPGFRGFAEMSAEEVADRTGLPLAAARLARARMFSEPGVFESDDLDGFLAAAGAAGLSARRGGRFLTLSFGATKADRMDELIRRYRPRRTLALGDAPNDVEMLARADIGVIVANPAAPPLPRQPGEATGKLIRTAAPGPEGWAQAVTALLDSHFQAEDQNG